MPSSFLTVNDIFNIAIRKSAIVRNYFDYRCWCIFIRQRATPF